MALAEQETSSPDPRTPALTNLKLSKVLPINNGLSKNQSSAESELTRSVFRIQSDNMPSRCETGIEKQVISIDSSIVR